MLSRYAALVKNLRGVVLAEVESPEVEAALQWLLKRFKYRDLGLPPSMAELRKRKAFRRLMELFHPAEELKRLAEAFAVELSAPLKAAEALVIASAYVSPVMAVGSWAAEALSRLAVEKIESKVKLDGKGWKLHFRIVDYTVLDAYEKSVAEAEGLWKPKLNLEAFKRKRIERIRRDVKRYWRLMEGEEEAKPLILYFDLALLAAENPKLLQHIKNLRSKEAAAGLALEVAILIPEGVETS
jgi:DNA-binding protein Fis